MAPRPPKSSRALRCPTLARSVVLSACLGLVAPAGWAAIDLQDDNGTSIHLAQPARRIISLAPHVTELIYAAGAGDRLVGAVEYSNFPEAAKKVPRVGGYGTLDLEAVAALKPDLVVAWKSGNRPEQLDRLRALGIPVFLAEPHRLGDVAGSLRSLGRLAGTESVAEAAARAFSDRQARLGARYSQRPPVRLFYQIWDRPLMTVNGDHIISDALHLCGGQNVFAGLPQLAPTLSTEAVLAADPEVLVASGMGEARPDWLDQWKRWPRLTATARGNLFFVPPDLIQRHTPRILDGAEMLCEQLEQARAKRLAGNLPPARASH